MAFETQPTPDSLIAARQVVVRPLVTEKGMHRSTRNNAYAFEVHVLATKADAVLMVVKEGAWGRDVVRRALSKLDAVHARILGAVLNCVDITSAGRSHSYYYRDYYGHGAYYGKPSSAEETAT